jgi:uncharacterized delta-60 repeat protein
LDVICVFIVTHEFDITNDGRKFDMTCLKPSPLYGLATLLVGLLLAGSAQATTGSPGTLDPFWGTGSPPPLGPGRVRTAVGGGSAFPSAIALQRDGKVVVAGTCSSSFCALRYNADGTLDMSFNGTGKVTTPLGTGASALAAAVQTDGRILLAGNCTNGTNQFCAVRYLGDGTLDPSFNGAGTISVAVGAGDASAKALALQPDGKIVLAGNCGPFLNGDFCALRLLTNGTPDPTFGSSGKVVIQMSSGDDLATGVVVQPDGKVVLAGGCSNGTNSDFCALRLLANGTPDPTFGSNGKVITAVGGDYEFARALALQPDGKLVLVGYCAQAGTSFRYFCAQRLLSTGAPDPGFGNPATGGVIIGNSFTVTRSDDVNAIALQPDGKLLLAGTCVTVLITDFCALRLHSNGDLDLSFNGTGKLLTSLSALAEARAIALQPDGKFLLSGYCRDINGGNYDFCTARYDGGPFGYKACSMDIDGDGSVLATTDSLIHARIAFGITGPAVINGITFAPNATRNTWPLIREYLVTQCGMSLAP